MCLFHTWTNPSFVNMLTGFLLRAISSTADCFLSFPLALASRFQQAFSDCLASSNSSVSQPLLGRKGEVAFLTVVSGLHCLSLQVEALNVLLLRDYFHIRCESKC